MPLSAPVPGTRPPQGGLAGRRDSSHGWETPDEDVAYEASDLDRNVVAIDQIRLIVQTFRDKVLKETFPERTEVPESHGSSAAPHRICRR